MTNRRQVLVGVAATVAASVVLQVPAAPPVFEAHDVVWTAKPLPEKWVMIGCWEGPRFVAEFKELE